MGERHQVFPTGKRFAFFGRNETIVQRPRITLVLPMLTRKACPRAKISGRAAIISHRHDDGFLNLANGALRLGIEGRGESRSRLRRIRRAQPRPVSRRVKVEYPAARREFTNAADGIDTQISHRGEMLDQIVERQFFANVEDDTGPL